MNEEVLFYYAILAGGIICMVLSVLLYFWLREDNGIEFSLFFRLVLLCLFGVGLVWYSAPSLKYVVSHDYATTKGMCTVEYDDQSSPRTIATNRTSIRVLEKIGFQKTCASDTTFHWSRHQTDVSR
ncbi:hypothetical protein [Exiguobacterium sp. S22-S28]|uniref:hypothetical protein n=1 Tax=Exiguobacterium sp. S22-S28 TaxID=3342768 RepID=UPI00372D2ED6